MISLSHLSQLYEELNCRTQFIAIIICVETWSALILLRFNLRQENYRHGKQQVDKLVLKQLKFRVTFLKKIDTDFYFYKMFEEFFNLRSVLTDSFYPQLVRGCRYIHLGWNTPKVSLRRISHASRKKCFNLIVIENVHCLWIL